MTLVGDVAMDAVSPISVTQNAAGLTAIGDPGCAAAIWNRAPLPRFQSWIDALEPEQLPNARMILRPEDIRVAALQVCETAGTPNCDERDRLIDDAAALADIFADLMRTPYLRLRFDVVTTDACWKFHTDALTARLICTYRGTGTQYGLSPDGSEPSRIFTVPTGAPIVLRGTLWPEQPKSGLRHRSPPISGTGETRLVMVLDPMTDPAAEPGRRFLH
ncbi:MAG: DUF1826 domain-containing protein [Pseudomonadota bacterium]